MIKEPFTLVMVDCCALNTISTHGPDHLLNVIKINKSLYLGCNIQHVNGCRKIEDNVLDHIVSHR